MSGLVGGGEEQDSGSRYSSTLGRRTTGLDISANTRGKQDPRTLCEPSDAFSGGIGSQSTRGYQQTGGNKRKSRFSFGKLVGDVIVNSLLGGLTSTMYYGADRAVGAVSDGIRGRRSSRQRIADNESGSNTVNPKDVNFMQSSIKNQTGEYTVLGNAEALRSGALKATDLPEIRIWQDADGKLWTLDHRRLASFRIAELDNVPFRWATDVEVANQMWKMTTKTNGTSVKLKLGNGQSMTVQ